MFAAAKWARLERHKRVAEITEHFALDDTPATRTAARIARAILSEPRLLLIDECGMDERLLQRTVSAFPGPTLLVTADLDLCHACAAELILLEAGRIVQSGPARETIDAPQSLAAAALLGFDNIFPASISALDPGRNSSRLECEHFALTGPYLPGHFNGDRVHVAVRAQDLRVHSGEIEPGPNFTTVSLLSASERTRCARLIFTHGIVAELTREQWEPQRNNKRWQVEFPSTALRLF
jgi:molybdate transport system ATP-binding protein